jgi:hypothetical protein
MKKLFGYIFIGLMIGILFIVIKNGDIDTETKNSAGPTLKNSKVKPQVNERDLEQRKKIYYEIAEEQDRISADDPDFGTKNSEIFDKIAKKYDMPRTQVLEILAEGTEKEWPLPPTK